MIYYNVIKRKSPKDGTVKFYASAQNGTYMNLEQVAANISRECTVTVHDVKAVLSSLQEQIRRPWVFPRNRQVERSGEQERFQKSQYFARNGTLCEKRGYALGICPDQQGHKA